MVLAVELKAGSGGVANPGDASVGAAGPGAEAGPGRAIPGVTTVSRGPWNGGSGLTPGACAVGTLQAATKEAIASAANVNAQAHHALGSVR